MGLVVAFVLLLGGVIKNYTPIKNELIPLITWILGGLLYQWLAGGWSDPRQWMMALISVAGATGLHSATRSTAAAVKGPGDSIPPLGIWLLGGLLSLSLVGCVTPSTQRPPSPTEQKYFAIKTNVVEVVTTVTNIVPATETTVAAIRVAPATNRVEQYELTPNATAQLTAATAASVGNVWGVGGAVGGAVMGLFSLWGLLRSRKQAVASAAELAQIIETGRQVLLALPNGTQYEAAWKEWMVKHQSETETISNISKLVALSVNNDQAKGAAQAIVNLIQATK